jgi:hypothetical protein
MPLLSGYRSIRLSTSSSSVLPLPKVHVGFEPDSDRRRGTRKTCCKARPSLIGEGHCVKGTFFDMAVMRAADLVELAHEKRGNAGARL